MQTCPECREELSDGGGRCARCGHGEADGPVWRMVFKTREALQKHYDRYMVHHGLVAPRNEPVEHDSPVRLRLVLPDEGGEVWLKGRVITALAQPAGSKAAYAVQIELFDLTTEKKEILRPVTRSAGAPSARAEVPERHTSDDLDDFVDALIERQAQPQPVDPPASAGEEGPREPLSIRDSLPEELAEELTDFTLQFVRAVTKSSYYTAEHQEAGKAKLGIYAAFQKLVAERPEVTFYARQVGEKYAILVYGIFQEPTDLAKAMLRGTSEIYVPKLAHYFEANGLLSISFKPALTEDEFHQFVDLLAGPSGVAPGSANTILHRLAQNRIHNISVVVVEDRIGGRRLSWRVEMALTRLKKDLSVIPLYEHLSEDELRQIRLQVFRDVLRPLREVGLIRELLENCDRIIEEVEEFTEDQLAEIEAHVLTSVPEASLPTLFEGLAQDIAEAKRKSEKQMERLLRLTRRVASQLSPEQAKSLEDAFRMLVNENALGAEELPAFLQRKFRAERDAATFLNFQERILARLDRESNAERYQAILGFFDSIFTELITRADPSPTLTIIDHVSEHRIVDPPFSERPMLAAVWLEGLVYSSLAEDLVRELSNADRLKRNSLLELCRRLGDETVPILFRALFRCENASTRQAITEVLANLKYASRAFLRREFQEPDLPSTYLIELLRLLGRIGDEACGDILKSALGHSDTDVRIEALGAASALDAAEGEEMLLATLSDAEPKVRDTALKTLFDRGSTAPELFGFCGRILREPDEANEGIARLICSRLTAYDQGERREASVALLLGALGDARNEDGGWWSSLKRSVTTESEPVSVKVAACQALGRLRAAEASEVLERVSQRANPALKRAARHALDCIRDEKPRPPTPSG